MRSLLTLVCLLGFVGAAAAETNHQPDLSGKPAIIVYEGGERQGGDTVLNATFFTTLPYNDTGTTCNYVDDYDEACPYTGSTSPDVVYEFAPLASVLVDIDLCGSTYDTKLYVYQDAVGNLVACNDDFYFDDVCGVYVSKLEGVPVLVGATYYIIIDGYGGDCGDYAIAVTEGGSLEPCSECPPEAVPEGEPDIVDEYIDMHNGGCNSDPFVIQYLETCDGSVLMCCNTGTYVVGGINSRDTDWFEIMGAGGDVTFTVESNCAVNMYVLNTDCNSIELLHQLSVEACVPGTIVFPLAAGEIVWLWVGPQEFSGIPQVDYILSVSGIASGGPSPVETTSWGAIKNLYK
ncbi:hypothetical protein ACFL6M_00830 [Candidatus Eisenbacteria bacterium]|uniref:Uncharacterized protein n=1 Tax=Eiseniibacteriota bacterium TaxID=2212470 RepID=A0ABV6YIG1_UNCEI